MPPSTRRTRANPSPGGFKSLDMLPKKAKPTPKKITKRKASDNQETPVAKRKHTRMDPPALAIATPPMKNVPIEETVTYRKVLAANPAAARAMLTVLEHYSNHLDAEVPSPNTHTSFLHEYDQHQKNSAPQTPKAITKGWAAYGDENEDPVSVSRKSVAENERSDNNEETTTTASNEEAATSSSHESEAEPIASHDEAVPSASDEEGAEPSASEVEAEPLFSDQEDRAPPSRRAERFVSRKRTEISSVGKRNKRSVCNREKRRPADCAERTEPAARDEELEHSAHIDKGIAMSDSDREAEATASNGVGSAVLDSEEELQALSTEDEETMDTTDSAQDRTHDATPATPSTPQSSWARLSNLSAILSPMNLIRTPLNFLTRRQSRNPPATVQPKKHSSSTTPQKRQQILNNAPATIAHPRRHHSRTSSTSNRTQPILATSNTEQRLAGRRFDSHLPIHLRGCLYRDLPKEWQARSQHMRPKAVDQPVDVPATGEKRKRASTVQQTKAYDGRLGDQTFGLPANFYDSSDDEEDVNTGNNQTSNREQNSPSDQRSKRAKQQTTSNCYNKDGRTYFRSTKTFVPGPDFVPTYAFPDYSSDSDSNDEEDAVEERPSKRTKLAPEPEQDNTMPRPLNDRDIAKYANLGVVDLPEWDISEKDPLMAEAFLQSDHKPYLKMMREIEYRQKDAEDGAQRLAGFKIWWKAKMRYEAYHKEVAWNEAEELGFRAFFHGRGMPYAMTFKESFFDKGDWPTPAAKAFEWLHPFDLSPPKAKPAPAKKPNVVFEQSRRQLTAEEFGDASQGRPYTGNMFAIQAREASPSNERLDKARKDALKHKPQVPSNLCHTKMMSPMASLVGEKAAVDHYHVGPTPIIDQRIIDAYAPITNDLWIIRDAEAFDITPFLLKWKKRGSSWVDPGEDEERRLALIEA